MEPLLTSEQAGPLIGLSKTQMYVMCGSRAQARQKHPMPFLKVGKYLRFRASSLDAWATEIETKRETAGR